jgi:hypothetical protein
MASKEPSFIALHPSISRQVEDLIINNRADLIKSTVKDSAAQKELLSIAESIQRIRVKDPSLVAAWGLGCGNNCVVAPGDIVGRPLGIRPTK